MATRISNHVVLPFHADWSREVSHSLRWNSEIEPALRGNEQRGSYRSNPRLTLSFTADRRSVAENAELRTTLLEGYKFVHGVPGANLHVGKFAAPWHGKAVWLDAAAAEDATELQIEPTAWLPTTGWIIALPVDESAGWVAWQITAVDGWTLTVANRTGLAAVLPAGTLICPLVFGTLSLGEIPIETYLVGDAPIRIEATDGYEVPGDVPSVCTGEPYAVVPGFVLFLCLDETGSIGVGGAARGVEIIDEFRDAIGDERILGVGFQSFGDSMVLFQPISADLDAVRAILVTAAGGTGPFFGDTGGDTPENGVDALNIGVDELTTSPIALRARYRYLALKTDTWGFAHNETDPSTVFAKLSGISKTWLEFNSGASHEGTSYEATFPANEKIIHGAFAL